MGNTQQQAAQWLEANKERLVTCVVGCIMTRDACDLRFRTWPLLYRPKGERKAVTHPAFLRCQGCKRYEERKARSDAGLITATMPRINIESKNGRLKPTKWTGAKDWRNTAKSKKWRGR